MLCCVKQEIAGFFFFLSFFEFAVVTFSNVSYKGLKHTMYNTGLHDKFRMKWARLRGLHIFVRDRFHVSYSQC